MEPEQTAFDRFSELYNSGDMPWDDELPPPEVRDLVQTLSAGRALDLGCGYGRAAIYLARRGWQVDGVDFMPQAIVEAEQRARAAGVTALTTFYTGSVSALDFLPADSYGLAVDVGCFHALDDEQQVGYAAGLERMLLRDGVFILFARLRAPEPTEERQRGIVLETLLARFASGFDLRRQEIGVTGEDESAWPSGWFWFERRVS